MDNSDGLHNICTGQKVSADAESSLLVIDRGRIEREKFMNDCIQDVNSFREANKTSGVENIHSWHREFVPKNWLLHTLSPFLK